VQNQAQALLIRFKLQASDFNTTPLKAAQSFELASVIIPDRLMTT
jgi:hypothetical protein